MPAVRGSGLVLAAHSAPGGAGLSSWGPTWGRGAAVPGHGGEQGRKEAWALWPERPWNLATGQGQPGIRLGAAGSLEI